MKLTTNDCKPLHFFRKLPPYLKVEIDELVAPLFNPESIEHMIKNNYLLETVYLLTPEMADHLTKFSDDYKYHTIHGLYNLIQPILKEILEGRNYYERYPEYLI